MSLTTTPAIQYESIQRTTAVLSGPPRRRYNLPGDCPIQFAAYAFDQECEMLLANFPPTQKNAIASAGAFAGLLDNNAILTKLSQPTPTGGGKGKFTASFAIVPASWDEFVSQTVTYPGIRDVAYTGGVRDPKPLNVTTRQRKDYFVVDPSSLSAGAHDSGGAAVTIVANKGLIPVVYRTPWKFLYSGAVLNTSEVTGLVKAGGIIGWYETVPNTGTYQNWIAKAIAAGWTGTVWDGTYPVTDSNISQFCFQDSVLRDYEGGIVERTSFYALAE